MGCGGGHRSTFGVTSRLLDGDYGGNSLEILELTYPLFVLEQTWKWSGFFFMCMHFAYSIEFFCNVSPQKIERKSLLGVLYGRIIFFKKNNWLYYKENDYKWGSRGTHSVKSFRNRKFCLTVHNSVRFLQKNIRLDMLKHFYSYLFS